MAGERGIATGSELPNPGALISCQPGLRDHSAGRPNSEKDIQGQKSKLSANYDAWDAPGDKSKTDEFGTKRSFETLHKRRESCSAQLYF